MRRDAVSLCFFFWGGDCENEIFQGVVVFFHLSSPLTSPCWLKKPNNNNQKKSECEVNKAVGLADRANLSVAGTYGRRDWSGDNTANDIILRLNAQCAPFLSLAHTQAVIMDSAGTAGCVLHDRSYTAPPFSPWCVWAYGAAHLADRCKCMTRTVSDL